MTDSLDLVQHLYRARAFSIGTFGPGARTEGVLNHMQKEMQEVRDAVALHNEPHGKHALREWIDLMILSMDGALRCCDSPEEVVEELLYKHDKNEHRSWPDWHTADPNKAIEHVREPLIEEVDYKGDGYVD